MKLEDVATRLEALGNPTRLEIVRILVRTGSRGLAVGELRQRIDIAASTLSHHLTKLITVGLVSQEPFLFNNTIKYNITYNRYNVPEQKLEEAVLISNAIHFITQDEAFEGQHGLDENVTEKVEDETGFLRNVGVKGSKLSGGQKQRLAIARAVLREPNAYLYDEATSALDSNSEKVVQDALDKLAEGKTCISIAHRVSTCR